MTEDLDLDAAEYVIGTLDPDERAAFAARLAIEERARAAVAAWETRLASLSDAIAPIAPPPETWSAIDRAVRRGRGPRFAVIEGGAKAIEGGVKGQAPGAAGDPTRLRRALNRWRAVAIASSGLAAALLVFVGHHEFGGAAGGPETSYVAAINPGGGKPAMLVRVDLKTHRVFVRPVAAETPRGKSLELWYISDGKPPRSLGVVAGTPLSLTVPAGTHPTDATFAVPVEPPGGSPTGGPTGPVVYSGQLVKE